MEIKQYKLERLLTDKEGSKLKGKFLDAETYIKYPIIDHDADGYDENGKLLFRFRKNVLPLDILKLGVDNFEYSIELTEGRGVTSGSSHKRIRKDGSVSKITVGNKVLSGVAGYMDPVSMVPYCRTTAFNRKYFDKFTAAIPFVEAIDRLYAELAPEHYTIQKMYADATHINYRIANTSFTTITCNKNFRTAAHRDAGDLEEGFGNLIAYREGHYEGGYFMLPEYGVGIDLDNCSVLFVNVHKIHGNSEFLNCSPDWKRISFVLYYRRGLLDCEAPSKELERIKKVKNGYNRL